jgi:D-glycero-D-manno-heptose 1,7-bisphosphate phosphatase
MNRALFLDLDGTIIKTKSGKDYPIDTNDWEFMPAILTLIKKYNDEGFIIIIVSNQGGIEAGIVDAVKFDEKFDKIRNEIAQYTGENVNGMYCPFLNKDHYHRKPNPGMAYTAALKLELSLRNSIMVGDMDSDAKFAKNAYIGTYYDIKDFLRTESNV